MTTTIRQLNSMTYDELKAIDGDIEHVNIFSAPYSKEIKMRKYSGAYTAKSSMTKPAAYAARQAFPHYTRSQHLLASRQLRIAASAFEAAAISLRQAASCITFARSTSATLDYKVSAIGREEYPEQVKDAIRTAAHAETNCRNAASAHEYAAKYLSGDLA